MRHSPDNGHSWNLIEDPEEFENDAWIAGLTDTPEGLVAVGQYDGTAAMWTSRDGIDWKLTDLDEPVFDSVHGFYDIVLHDQILYIGGWGGVWARINSY